MAVEVGGDLRIRGLDIGPGVVRARGAREVAGAIVDAYNTALTNLQGAQWRFIRDSLRTRTEEPA